MAFNPLAIDEDATAEGHLDSDPMYEILVAVQKAQATGRLTVEDAAGENHMYFMQGQPVGVQLAEYIHPLGQLLLELGKVDGRGFVRAQRLIWANNRLAGQVFKELGFLDERSLKDVLATQARKKAEHFCRFASRPFAFGRGLAFLSGFSATPLNIHTVIFLAVRQQMGRESRAAYVERMRQSDVRLRAQPEKPLPAPLAAYGFGPPEERFLLRIAAGWQHVQDLADTGTLPVDEMAVLLRYLELSARLDLRAHGAQATAAPLAASTEDDVFSTTSKPHATKRAPAPSPAAAMPSADTAPRAARRSAPETSEPAPTVKTPVARPPAPVEKHKAPRAVPVPVPAPAPFPSEKTLDPPEVKKKKKSGRRNAPEPSVGTVAVSETKREKTHVGPLPSIVIDEE